MMGNNNSATRRLTKELSSLPSSPESESLSSTTTQDGSACSQQSLASIRLEPLDHNPSRKKNSLITGRNNRINHNESKPITLPPIEWPDFSSGKVLPFKEYKKWLTSFRNRENNSSSQPKRLPMNRCKTATFRICRSPRKECIKNDGKVFVVDEEKRRRAENRIDLTAINHAMTQPRNKVVPVTQLNVRQLKPCHWFDKSTGAPSNSTMAVIKNTRSSALNTVSYDLLFDADQKEVTKKPVPSPRRPPTHLSPIVTRKSF